MRDGTEIDARFEQVNRGAVAPCLRRHRRHTTAVYLMKSGVDVATISQWLEHATLNTTIRYARADMDLKRQALSQVFPEILGTPKGGRVRLDGIEITTWLRRL
jgi:integrase/recombinase XerD